MKKIAYYAAGTISALGLAGLVTWSRLEHILFRLQIPQLKRLLVRELGRERARRVVSSMRDHYEEISSRRPKTEKGVFRFHRSVLITGLALYRALGEEMEEHVDLVKRTHRLLWESGLRTPFRFLAFLLRHKRDPFAAWERIARLVNDRVFPCPPYQRDYVDMAEGFGFDYTRCYYCDFFAQENTPELTEAFCDMDDREAELLPPQIQYRRDLVLARGDERCEFRYFRR